MPNNVLSSKNQAVIPVSLVRRFLEIWVYLLPFVPVLYLSLFQRQDLQFKSHMFHEVAILAATLEGAGISYVCWLSYLQSGEIFVKRLAMGFIGFTVVYSMHGIFTPMAASHMALFLLYGPASRFVMSLCLLFAMQSKQLPDESEVERRQVAHWWRWVLCLMAINALVGVVATSSYGNEPFLRAIPEFGALLLHLVSLARLFNGGIRSPLINSLGMSMVWFCAASLSFLLAAPWNHQWWLAHGLFAVGFSILGYGILKAYQNSYVLEKSFTTADLFDDLAAVNGKLKDALQSQETANQELRQQMRELEVAHQQFTDLVAIAPDAILVVSTSGIIMEANPKAEDLFGYPEGALRGRPLEELVPLDSRELHQGHRQTFDFKPRLRQMGLDQVPLKGMRLDGSHFLAHIRISGLLFQGQQCVVAFVRAAGDTATRYMQDRQTDLQAIDRGRCLDAICENVPQLFFELSRTAGGSYALGCMSRMASQFLDATGDESPDDCARKFFSQILPADLPIVISAIESAASNKSNWAVQWRHHLPGRGMTSMVTQAVLQSPLHEGRIAWLCIAAPAKESVPK